jgi:hypothetical protein
MDAPLNPPVDPSAVPVDAPAGAERARIAVLIDSATITRWMDRVIAEILESSWGSLALVIKTAAAAEESPTASETVLRPRAPLLHRLYLGVDDRTFARECQPDALAATPTEPRLGSVPAVVWPSAAAEADTASSDSRDVTLAIRQHALDVILDFRRNPTATVLGEASRFGLWSIHHGDPAPGPPWAPGFWEVLDRAETTLSVLQATGSPVLPSVVLSSGRCRTDERSVRRHWNRLAWQGARLILCTLKLVQSRPESVGRARANTAAPGPGRAPSAGGNWRIARRLASLYGRAARSKVESLMYRRYWAVAIALHPDFRGPCTTWRDVRYLTPPDGRSWADPFVVRWQDRHFIFFEEILHDLDKGRIGVMQVDSSGSATYAGVALEHDHHMSYPFIFSWRSELFMIPEEGASRQVRVYRCAGFPDRWVPEQILLEGVRAVDTTLHFDGQCWWMFVNMGIEGGSMDDECHLFYGTRPLGPWTPHKRNPVRTGLDNTRPAGALFERRGTLYRPTQDCSSRYGGAVVINRVVRLDRDEYAEEPAFRIESRRGITRTHTLNSCEGATVVDLFVEQFRLASSPATRAEPVEEHASAGDVP